MLNDRRKRRAIEYTGFTVIELLVVIVVIGILAAITIVSYTAVQNQSYQANLEVTLQSIGSKLEKYNRENGTYPTTQTDFEALANDTTDITYVYVASPTGQYYCLAGTSNRNSIGTYRLMAGETAKAGNCSSVTFPDSV